MTGGRTLSTFLRVRHVQKLNDAVLLSLRSGSWFNRVLNVQFATARLGDNARDFLCRFLKLIRDWLAKRGAGPMCYAGVFESVGGLHLHLLLHVPIGLWADFLRMEHRWLRRALRKSSGEYRAKVLRGRAIIHYEKFLLGHASETDYLKQLRGTVMYRLKGATRMDTGSFLGMADDEIGNNMKPSPQGRVWGRRVIASQNLLSRGACPPLHPDPKMSWLEAALGELEAGRALHEATLKLGDPPPGISVMPVVDRTAR